MWPLLSKPVDVYRLLHCNISKWNMTFTALLGITKIVLSYFDVAQSKVKYNSTHANECGLSRPIRLVVHL